MIILPLYTLQKYNNSINHNSNSTSFQSKKNIINDLFLKTNKKSLLTGACISGYYNIESKNNINKGKDMNIQRNEKAKAILLEDIKEIEYAYNEENKIEDTITDIPHVEYTYYDDNDEVRKIEKFYQDGSVSIEIFDEDGENTYIGNIEKYRLDSFFTCSRCFYDKDSGNLIKEIKQKLDNNFNLYP